MAPEKKPCWQPISALPLLASSIDGMLESVEDNQRNFEQAKERPWVFDDYTVGRASKVYTNQLNDLWIYEEQLDRWNRSPLTIPQRQEVQRLTGQVRKLRAVLTSVLALIDELKKGTIEKMLAKSDFEVGVEALVRRFKL